jgi:hypothetical protein
MLVRGLLHSGVDLGFAGPSVWKQHGPTPTVSATGRNSSGTRTPLLRNEQFNKYTNKDIKQK